VFGDDGSYEVRDSIGSVLDSGSHHDGDTIAYGGVQLRITGEPASGDSFTIAPAGTRDIFSTLDNLVQALGSDPSNAQQLATKQNALQASLRDITTGQQRLIDARAKGGANQAAIDDANALNEAREVNTKISLSEIRDLDYAEALSRYSQEKTALTAAQKVFAQFKQMSLFNEI
jgi:flagellar hook-associated protein 3 FlgL